MEGDAANITYKTDTDPEIESVKDALDKCCNYSQEFSQEYMAVLDYHPSSHQVELLLLVLYILTYIMLTLVVDK